MLCHIRTLHVLVPIIHSSLGSLTLTSWQSATDNYNACNSLLGVKQCEVPISTNRLTLSPPMNLVNYSKLLPPLLSSAGIAIRIALLEPSLVMTFIGLVCPFVSFFLPQLLLETSPPFSWMDSLFSYAQANHT